MEYPIRYNMDGIFCQIERDGKPVHLCFSDMAPQERSVKLQFYSRENLISVIEILCNTLRDLGDRYGFIANDPERIEEVSI